jgi:hypothetical protein
LYENDPSLLRPSGEKLGDCIKEVRRLYLESMHCPESLVPRLAGFPTGPIAKALAILVDIFFSLSQAGEVIMLVADTRDCFEISPSWSIQELQKCYIESLKKYITMSGRHPDLPKLCSSYLANIIIQM